MKTQNNYSNLQLYDLSHKKPTFNLAEGTKAQILAQLVRAKHHRYVITHNY
jgi:hypothetical protein